MMQQIFDSSAEYYDEYFTNSIIGTAQRNIVHAYLKKILPDKSKLNILELNCGTGEDAIFFSQLNHKVLATDASEKMLIKTENKIRLRGNHDLIRTRILDLRMPDHFNLNEKFDMIFSNFGGLNCLSPAEFNKFPGLFKYLLNPGGRIIFVLMPKFCLWEFIYFGLKLKFKKSLRRISTSGTLTQIGNNEFRTYYYSSGDVKKIFGEDFEVIAIKPVGFLIPPSYLENFFKNKKRIFRTLSGIERIISDIKFIARFSDHFLIDLKVKK